VACWPLAAGRKQSTKEAPQQTKLQLHEAKKKLADEKHELHPFCPQVLQLTLRVFKTSPEHYYVLLVLITQSPKMKQTQMNPPQFIATTHAEIMMMIA
jgi:hypothetical protein